MRKILCLCFATIIMCATLSGCANKITEGEVYKKEFLAAQAKVLILPLSIYNGKTLSVIMIPYIRHYPDRYVIYIRDVADKNKTQIYYTTEEVYNKINVGDMFKYDKNRDLDEEPYTQERKNDC